jgi:hypothetical protein
MIFMSSGSIQVPAGPASSRSGNRAARNRVRTLDNDDETVP